MAEYLLTACNPQGRKVTERVETTSADLAVQQLRDRGYVDIVLHTDDVMALYTHQSKGDKIISPREYVAFHKFGDLGHIFFNIRKVYLVSWKVYLLAAFLLVVRWLMGSSWDLLAYLLCAILVLPLIWVPLLRLSGPGRRYNRLLEAAAWERWEKMLRLLPTISNRLPPDESAFREAQALAGLGRLEEALPVVQPFADGSGIPEWHYWSRLTEVYSAAGQRDQAIASKEKAAELAPGNPPVLLDLAMLLLRHKRDTRRAKQLLEQAKTHEISDHAKLAVDFVEGLLALEEGNAFNAKHLFERSLEQMMDYKANPIVRSAIDGTHAYLALALAALGDHAGAVRCYRRAEPRLRARRSEELIRRCEQELGLHTVDQ